MMRHSVGLSGRGTRYDSVVRGWGSAFAEHLRLSVRRTVNSMRIRCAGKMEGAAGDWNFPRAWRSWRALLSSLWSAGLYAESLFKGVFLKKSLSLQTGARR